MSLQEENEGECNNNFSIGVYSIALAAPFNRNSTQAGSHSHSKWNNNAPNAHNSNAHNSNAQVVVFGVAPNGMKSKFFCTNCHVWGHRLDKCIKVNNNRDKGKRAAH